MHYPTSFLFHNFLNNYTIVFKSDYAFIENKLECQCLIPFQSQFHYLSQYCSNNFLILQITSTLLAQRVKQKSATPVDNGTTDPKQNNWFVTLL
jgi:hypothetical protein